MELNFLTTFIFLSITSTLLSVAGQGIQIPFLPRQRRCQPFRPPSQATSSARDLAVCRSEVAAARQLRAPDVDKRTDEIVRENGHDLETHLVTSEDNYILTVYRVAGGGRSPRRAGKPAVLVYHGMGLNSDSFLIQPYNRTLISKLVEAGYDVWLPNGRGADFSEGHRTLDSQRDLEYWDFSFHEMGVYDIPAIVDYMIERTQNEKVFYIGVSQGGSNLMAGLSEVTSLNDKLHAAFLLAPAVYLGAASMQALTMWLPLLYTPLQTIIYHSLRGRIEEREPRVFLPFLGLDSLDICSNRVIQCDLCDNAFYALFDFNPNQMNYTNTPYIMRSLNTVSVQSLVHLGQNLLSCQFRKYDYGSAIENRRRYGVAEPPSYQLANVRTPIHIYYGEHDLLVPPPDIERLVRALPTDVVRERFLVQDELFNHPDFFTGRDADILVYDPVIRSMNQYIS